MSALISVARYHLVDRWTLVVLPWAALAFGFAVDLIIFAVIPVGHHLALTPGGVRPVAVTTGRYGGGLGAIGAVFLAAGVISIGRSLPFGLTLGFSRRTYYAGTAALAAALAVLYSLVLAGLQAIERATGGWGVTMHVFQVPTSCPARGT